MSNVVLEIARRGGRKVRQTDRLGERGREGEREREREGGGKGGAWGYLI